MKLIACLLLCCMNMVLSAGHAQQSERPSYVLVIHGGAGTIVKAQMSDELEAAYRQALQEALDTGEKILAAGGSSLDAVEATIQSMESSPLFNAGKGAVFTHEEAVELDAAFMDGKSGNAGAVAGVRHIKHPVSAARLVMEQSPHVMLSGAGADAFAREGGLEMVENSYFHTDRRLQQVRRMKSAEPSGGDGASEPGPIKKKYGTVGAVALDQSGNLAAATSTGGMTNKRYGRIGDAPIIGAGTFADNNSCAVSCTGHGEYFMRNVVAYDVAARMKYGGLSLDEAATTIIHEVLVAQGGTGGLIAVDKDGNISMPFNTSGMYRGYVNARGESKIAIYQD